MLKWLFHPPKPPPLDFPWWAKLSGGARKTIYEAIELSYFGGVRDGGIVIGAIMYVLGILTAMLLMVLVKRWVETARNAQQGIYQGPAGPTYYPPAAALLLALLLASPSYGQAEHATVNGPVFQGVQVQVDFPPSENVRNIPAPIDGQGLCVFASMDMAARDLSIYQLVDILHKVKRGGGWPEKVDQVVKEHAPGVKVIQYNGRDPALMDAALKTGRPACVTYGFDERYHTSTIYHMVILVHLDASLAAVIDNNFPGHEDTYSITWMSRAEFLRRWTHPNGGWCYVFDVPPAPPPPKNLKEANRATDSPDALLALAGAIFLWTRRLLVG